jgi:hypothetical protein
MPKHPPPVIGSMSAFLQHPSLVGRELLRKTMDHSKSSLPDFEHLDAQVG